MSLAVIFSGAFAVTECSIREIGRDRQVIELNSFSSAIEPFKLVVIDTSSLGVYQPPVSALLQ